MACQYRPFCICCTRRNGFQLYAVLFFHTFYKMIMSKFSAMALKVSVYSILFTLSKVIQAVSLNGGKLAAKQHPVVIILKSRIICLRDHFCCFFPQCS